MTIAINLPIYILIVVGLPLALSTQSCQTEDRCRKFYEAKDLEKAFQACLPSAERGDVYAGFAVAEIYSEGSAASGKDLRKAFDIYKRLAERGEANAQSRLGFAYSLGEGVPKNDAESAKWHLKAAKNGVAASMAMIAWDYALGRGIEENHEKAVAWTILAAEYGESLSQSALGADYERGDGVPEDYVKAYMWDNIAGANSEVNRSARDQLAERMTPEQIAQAQELCRNWKPRKGPLHPEEVP